MKENKRMFNRLQKIDKQINKALKSKLRVSKSNSPTNVRVNDSLMGKGNVARANRNQQPYLKSASSLSTTGHPFRNEKQREKAYRDTSEENRRLNNYSIDSDYYSKRFSLSIAQSSSSLHNANHSINHQHRHKNNKSLSKVQATIKLVDLK